MKVASTEFNGYRSDSKTWTDKLLRHNISHIEIAVANLPENEDDQHKIISYALAQGIALNLHAPYGINNISSTDKELRAFSIANVKRSIDLAAKYNLGVVTFHPGRLSDEKDDPKKFGRICWKPLPNLRNTPRKSRSISVWRIWSCAPMNWFSPLKI